MTGNTSFRRKDNYETQFHIGSPAEYFCNFYSYSRYIIGWSSRHKFLGNRSSDTGNFDGCDNCLDLTLTSKKIIFDKKVN